MQVNDHDVSFVIDVDDGKHGLSVTIFLYWEICVKTKEVVDYEWIYLSEYLNEIA